MPKNKTLSENNFNQVELSIVMPCLNEAETLQSCIQKAKLSLKNHAINGEIIVADNGSTDGSQEIARRLGARVVTISEKGYGHALRGGIIEARGKYIIMGDADDSYDFSDIYPFIKKLREGLALVMGNRFLGAIEPGAMPWKHRWIGNPILSWIGRLFFKSSVRDFHCGLRGFSKEAFMKMDLQTGGMEFASEMVIKSTILKLRMSEVPITLHKDGRSRPPHLRSWRDGWRHLRFMLLFSPRWLFLIPGSFLFGVGVITSCILLSGPQNFGFITLDIHTLLASSFVALLGYQILIFALFTKIFAVVAGLHPDSTKYNKIFRYVTLEAGLVIGLLFLLIGGFFQIGSVMMWKKEGFGNLDPQVTMRRLIPGVCLMFLGVQTIFSSFLFSLLGLIKDKIRGKQ